MKYVINFPNNPFVARNLGKIKDVLGIRPPSEEMYSESLNVLKDLVNGIISHKEACNELLHRELNKQIAENIRLKRELRKNDDIPSAYPGSTFGRIHQERTVRPTFVIDKVIFNPPATIVFWKDGTKTVVKCKEGEEFSEWAGIALCLAKKLYGPNFHKIFKTHCSDPEKTVNDMSDSEIAKAARQAINGMHDARNVNNIVALFMKTLRDEVTKRGEVSRKAEYSFEKFLEDIGKLCKD